MDDDSAPDARRHAEVLRLAVEPSDEGARLDRYVADRIADLSRSYARQLIEDGHIRLNGADARPSAALRAGDVVLVLRPIAQPTDLLPQPIPLDVVYEDGDVVVIDKPAGMVVHPAPGHLDGTLVNALLARYPDITVGSDLRPGIVHRLDRDTSGLLVVARNDAARHSLQAQQQAHTMAKAYLAVVEGRFKEPSGLIDAPIARHPTDRLRQAIVASGRSARTHWRVLEALGEYTLIEARLETGRTHQIRVHFSYKSRPLLGDPLYGPKKPRATFGLARQFLHAYRLGFALPSSGAWAEFESPLPADLQAALNKLRAQAA
ncbi:MAG TPA: RluA family pseudouridine synthase [Kouleothrix sp.]|uniref:RluA family pseudouridine synthase n=1 Tax=Kouleothrix sp. TaxID=2779161 RepID=UPI002C214984|nr:RluA family pseudouridine synthase [Kouleothrix sp.]HRC74482.1 RluA family pseudouridine synthase [Kouleothrix sp.]